MSCGTKAVFRECRAGRCISRILLQVVVAAGVLLASCSHVWSEEQAGRGEALLRKMGEVYETVKSYEDETTVVINWTAQGTEEKVEMRYSLLVQRPNKLALKLKSGMMGITIVSDGERLYTYIPMLKKYTVEEAPGSLEEISRRSLLGMGRSAAGRIISVIPLFGDDPYGTIMKGVGKAEFVGDETVDGTKTFRIRLDQEQADIDFWIDAESCMVRKVMVDMAKAMESWKQRMPDAGDMKMVWEERHQQIKIGETIPKDRFVFEPPEGATETEDFFATPHDRREERSPWVGKRAQNFTLEGLKEGTSIQLGEYHGKVIMLDFWATWCGPCHQEMPILQKVYDQYKDKGLIFVAINAQEDRETVEEFVTKKGYAFPVALDTNGKVGDLYEVPGLPTLFLIGKQGRIQKVHVGFAPGLKETLEKELDKLLAGKALVE